MNGPSGNVVDMKKVLEAEKIPRRGFLYLKRQMNLANKFSVYDLTIFIFNSQNINAVGHH